MGKLISILALQFLASFSSPKQQPQVTIILMDDVGKEVMAMANTPNLDTLASQGIEFTNAWSMPLCSPTRACVLTGKHAFRTGIGTVLNPGSSSAQDPNPGEVIIPEFLRVSNAAFGKYHLGTANDHPNLLGFQYYNGALWGLGDYYGGTGGYYNYIKIIQGVEFPTTEYDTLNIANDVVNNPNYDFRYIAFHASHKPLENPPGYQEIDDLSKYIASLEYMDGQIGRILQCYTGFVFILGDNGGLPISGGGKNTLYENGINVPFIVTGPGITPRVETDMINVTDIFATIANIYNKPISNNVAMDSISFYNLLFNDIPGIRVINFAEGFVPNHQPQNFRRVAIRDATHKLIIQVDDTELFFTMPGETLITPPYMGNDLIEYNKLKELLITKYQWN